MHTKMESFCFTRNNEKDQVNLKALKNLRIHYYATGKVHCSIADFVILSTVVELQVDERLKVFLKNYVVVMETCTCRGYCKIRFY